MEIDLGNLLGMAGQASGTVNNALSVFDRFRKLADDGKLPAESAETILALASQLSEAKVKLAHLESEIVELQRASDAHDEIKQRKRNYVLAETAVGERVYRLKDDAGAGELPHEVCPACFEQDRIRILQPRGKFLFCDSCTARYQAREIPGVTRQRRARTDDW